MLNVLKLSFELSRQVMSKNGRQMERQDEMGY